MVFFASVWLAVRLLSLVGLFLRLFSLGFGPVFCSFFFKPLCGPIGPEGVGSKEGCGDLVSPTPYTFGDYTYHRPISLSIYEPCYDKHWP